MLILSHVKFTFNVGTEVLDWTFFHDLTADLLDVNEDSI